MTPHSLILASSSPRRAELLRTAGYAFTVVAPPYTEPEHIGPDVPPVQQAEALSYFKARSVIPQALDMLRPSGRPPTGRAASRPACQGQVREGLILAADTLVALRGAIYGKPTDLHDARRILSTLAGTTHEVITGVTLLDAATRRRLIRHDATRVTMRPLSSEALQRYLDSGAWEGKAGAYGIQDHADPFVERIEGSFSNVVGLPMELVERMLAEWQSQEGAGLTVQGSASPVQSRDA